jgi:hypothetical protein
MKLAALRRSVTSGLTLALLAGWVATLSAAEWKVTTADGSSWFKLGLLVQG